MTYDQRGGTFDMGRVIQRTFDVLGRNLGPFAGMALVTTFLPQAVMAALSYFVVGHQDPANPLLLTWVLGVTSWVISVVGAYVLEAAVLYATVGDLNGRKVDLGASISTAFGYVLPLFGLGILMGLALVVGFVLFLVPGMMMAVAWIVAAPAIVIEKKGITESFGRSADLTRGSRWPIFGICVVYLVVYFAISWAVLAIFGGAFAAGGATDIPTTASLMNIFVTPLLSAVVAVVGATGVAAIYFELRSIKEGVGAKDLASVFD